MNGSLWTDREDNYVREHWGARPASEIATELGRTVQAIRTRANKCNLRSVLCDPQWLSAQALAYWLSLDENTPAKVIPARLWRTRYATNRKVQMLSRTAFIRWLQAPDHLIYYHPKNLELDRKFWMAHIGAKRRNQRRPWPDKHISFSRLANLIGFTSEGLRDATSRYKRTRGRNGRYFVKPGVMAIWLRKYGRRPDIAAAIDRVAQHKDRSRANGRGAQHGR